LLPGVVKSRTPVLGNGDPTAVWKIPLLGSNQRVVTAALNRSRSTVKVRTTGV
jgi:hypothetical protein